ncbi:MAG: hypothetical protein ACR2PR_06380 [Pseudohongiellaceae bacterium]
MTANVIKRCSCCRQAFPWTEEYFFRWNKTDKKLGGKCRVCRNAAKRKVYAKLAKSARYRKWHNKKVRDWRAANPDNVAAYRATQRAKWAAEISNNPEELRVMRIINNMNYHRRMERIRSCPVLLAKWREDNRRRCREQYQKRKDKNNATK